VCYLSVEEMTTAKLNVSIPVWIYFYVDSHSKVDGINTSAKASHAKAFKLLDEVTKTRFWML